MKRIECREQQYKFPFVAYVPENREKKLPLIIQLHGAGERGDGQEDLNHVEVYWFAKVMRQTDYECLLVMPQCPWDTFWSAKVESILQFIEQINETYPVDENRVYLTGVSMGGYGTWLTAMARPDLFAAIAPVCGGGMAWNAASLDMPIWTFHGSDDKIVSPYQSDEMVERLREYGKDVQYTRMDGVEHNVWDYAPAEEALKWMLCHSRK